MAFLDLLIFPKGLGKSFLYCLNGFKNKRVISEVVIMLHFGTHTITSLKHCPYIPLPDLNTRFWRQQFRLRFIRHLLLFTLALWGGGGGEFNRVGGSGYQMEWLIFCRLVILQLNCHLGLSCSYINDNITTA